MSLSHGHSHSQPPKDVAPFLKSLRLMLETESPEVLRWTDDGRAFEIHDMARMMAEVLPKYFKHCKYTSFQRQLNYFSFRKWTKSKAVVCTFSNDFFRRDQPELAWRITRKKSASSGVHGIHSMHSHPYARPQLPRPAVKRLDASPVAVHAHHQQLWRRPSMSLPLPFSLPLPSSSTTASPMRRFYQSQQPSLTYSPLTISTNVPVANDHAEPLDWMIDCLLPPAERAEDAGSYGCYAYGASADPKMGYVASLSM